jgi:hypothetical protein
VYRYVTGGFGDDGAGMAPSSEELRRLEMAGMDNLNPLDYERESAWFQPLSLKCDILV